MQRRALGRDVGLTARMTLALVLLAGTYVGIIVGCGFLIAYRPRYEVWWAVALAAIGTSVATRYRSGGRAILRGLGATGTPASRQDALRATVDRLAAPPEVAPPHGLGAGAPS